MSTVQRELFGRQHWATHDPTLEWVEGSYNRAAATVTQAPEDADLN